MNRKKDLTIKFTLTAGSLIKKDLISNLKDIAFDFDAKCAIDEDKGFFESNYRIKINLQDTEEKGLLLKRKIESLINIYQSN